MLSLISTGLLACFVVPPHVIKVGLLFEKLCAAKLSIVLASLDVPSCMLNSILENAEVYLSSAASPSMC